MPLWIRVPSTCFSSALERYTSPQGGTTLPLEKKDVDVTTIPFIKLDRQGSLRFRLYKKQADGVQAAGDLKALVRIEIIK